VKVKEKQMDLMTDSAKLMVIRKEKPMDSKKVKPKATY
jgi:hypothetical protein